MDASRVLSESFTSLDNWYCAPYPVRTLEVEIAMLSVEIQVALLVYTVVSFGVGVFYLIQWYDRWDTRQWQRRIARLFLMNETDMAIETRDQLRKMAE